MTERFLTWLDRKANDYLIWRHEQEREADRANGPCPDCGEGPLYCWCEPSAREQGDAESIYDAGRERGYEEGIRDGVRDAEGGSW